MMVGDVDELSKADYGRNYDLDDVRKWKKVMVEGGRMVQLGWIVQGLSSIIPAEIGILLILIYLDHSCNTQSSSLFSELGNLVSLTPSCFSMFAHS